MGGKCNTYGREEKNHIGFRWGNMKEIGHLEDPSVDGRILKWIFKKCDGGGGME